MNKYFQAFESGKLLYDKKHWNLHKIEPEQVCRKEIEDIETINMNPSRSIDKEFKNSESTTSSVASNSSDYISVGSQVSDLNKEVDKIFGPALERTHSGSDLKVTAPLRHKKRQYRSQEVLPLDNKTSHNSYQFTPERKVSLQDIPLTAETNNEELQVDKPQYRVPIIYDNNQRAEIVASVTERLYSKLKKKEVVKSKVENMVEKKIVEPLNELKICTNARQRLLELSQKALRNKRKIGIPAHTQTRYRVTRVKDQSIDVQTDLEPYGIKETNALTYYQHVGTETNLTTPRCKEASVGPQCGSLRRQDQSTITEQKKIILKSCSVMTENCVQNDRYTQTPIIPPPRKKKIKPRLSYIDDADVTSDDQLSPVISINILQSFAKEHESTSTSEDSLDNIEAKPTLTKKLEITPDLLTNHSSIDSKKVNVVVKPRYTSDNKINQENSRSFIEKSKTENDKLTANSNDVFSDNEDYNLPRVTVLDTSNSNKRADIRNLIMGHKKDIYPYNIVLSPPHINTENRRTVKFKDLDESSTLVSVASQTSCEFKTVPNLRNTENDIHSDNESESIKSDSTNNICSDSTNVTKTSNFVWKRGTCSRPTIDNTSRSFYLNQKNYAPVYKNTSANYKSAKTKLYKEFLGLDDTSRSHSDSLYEQNCASGSISNDTINKNEEEKDGVTNFKQKREFFESKGPSIFNQTKDPFYDFESKLLKSCDRLDASINKYDDYLKKYRYRSQKNLSPLRLNSSRKEFSHLRPKEYLQHLVELRKSVVKGDASSASSGSIF